MRVRDAGIFAIGLAAGLCSVLIGYVASAVFHPPAAQVSEVRGMPGPEIPPPSVTDFSRPVPLPSRPVIPPPDVLHTGEADRVAPASKPRLGMPVSGVRSEKLVDTFNESRGGHKHEALDILAPRGTPVLAAADGSVVKLFNSKQGGLTVYEFDPTGTWCYYYAHLDHYAPALREGMTVRQGDVLGYVGSTGDASPDAPHLHFALFRLGPEKQWWKGTAVNPLPMLK